MRFFFVLVFFIAQHPFCYAVKYMLIYKLESGAFGLATIHENSPKRFQLLIRTFKGDRGQQEELPQEKTNSSASEGIDNAVQSSEQTGKRKFQFNEKDVALFSGLIWFRQRSMDESLESYDVGPENPELWLPLQIVNSQLYLNGRILLDVILGKRDQLYFEKTQNIFNDEFAHGKVELEKRWQFDMQICTNHINDEKWLMVMNFDDFKYFTNDDTKEWDLFDRIKNVYIKSVTTDDITGKLLQTHCTSLRLLHGWQIFHREISINYLKIAYKIDRTIKLTSPDVDCAKMFESTAKIIKSGKDLAPQESPIKPHSPNPAEKIIEEESGSAAAKLNSIPLLPLQISQSLDNRDAWIATPKLAMYKDKCIFGSGVYNSGFLTLRSAYLDSRPFALENNDWSQWTLPVTYVDIALNPSESKVGVDKLVSSKYKNGKNGLVWKRMVVKSITEDAVKQSLVFELIDGYEVYVIFPRVFKPLLAFGMISVTDRFCGLFIQKIRTNGKVENMAVRFEDLLKNKGSCKIGLREADNYKKPPKKFFQFGKSTVRFVTINLGGNSWSDSNNQCIMNIDNSSMEEIANFLNLPSRSLPN